MGVTVVAGAGNEHKEVYQQPAKFDSVIAVAATNQYGNAWSSSNYGACVDISAPGEHIYTADIENDSSYTFYNGTSLSTPFVSAAAAYVLIKITHLSRLNKSLLKLQFHLKRAIVTINCMVQELLIFPT